MLCDRQQLDVGEAEGGNVVDDLSGQFIPCVDAATPGCEVQFVDPHRRGTGEHVAAAGHPCIVSPFVCLRHRNHAGITGGLFGLARHRVCFAQRLPCSGDNFKLVAVPGTGRWTHRRPDARWTVGVDHRQGLGLPVVPIANDRHVAGIGRPERELHRADTGRPGPDDLRAEDLPEPTVMPFAQQMKVEFANGAGRRRRRGCARFGGRDVGR